MSEVRDVRRMRKACEGRRMRKACEGRRMRKACEGLRNPVRDKGPIEGAQDQDSPWSLTQDQDSRGRYKSEIDERP